MQLLFHIYFPCVSYYLYNYYSECLFIFLITILITIITHFSQCLTYYLYNYYITYTTIILHIYIISQLFSVLFLLFIQQLERNFAQCLTYYLCNDYSEFVLSALLIIFTFVIANYSQVHCL